MCVIMCSMCHMTMFMQVSEKRAPELGICEFSELAGTPMRELVVMTKLC